MNFYKKLFLLLTFLYFATHEALAMDDGPLPLKSSSSLRKACGKPVPVGSPAEWFPAKTILMHPPGNEQFLGILYPPAALFEGAFDVIAAQKQHAEFVSHLEQNEITVYNVKEVLLQGTRDKNGDVKNEEELQELRNFAFQFLKKTLKIDVNSRIEENFPEKLNVLTNPLLVLNALSPEALVDLILLNPTIHLETTGHHNTGFKAKYELAPCMNLMFLRDQMITTKKGVVLGKMNSSQRSSEPKIIEFILKKLGIKIFYTVTGDGRLEGGDFLSADDTAFIGQGLRTNEVAIQELLTNKVFGTEYVAVVKDTWNNQQEMHLDTYFNIINDKLAVLSEWRSNSGKKEGKDYPTLVDVYHVEGDTYNCIHKDKIFTEYLKEKQFKVILVSESDQKNYGINFLTIAPNKILAIDGVSEQYKQYLRDAGVTATWMNFSALTQAYGAAHCLTQVLFRSK